MTRNRLTPYTNDELYHPFTLGAEGIGLMREYRSINVIVAGRRAIEQYADFDMRHPFLDRIEAPEEEIDEFYEKWVKPLLELKTLGVQPLLGGGKRKCFCNARRPKDNKIEVINMDDLLDIWLYIDKPETLWEGFSKDGITFHEEGVEFHRCWICNGQYLGYTPPQPIREGKTFVPFLEANILSPFVDSNSMLYTRELLDVVNGEDIRQEILDLVLPVRDEIPEVGRRWGFRKMEAMRRADWEAVGATGHALMAGLIVSSIIEPDFKPDADDVEMFSTPEGLKAVVEGLDKELAVGWSGKRTKSIRLMSQFAREGIDIELIKELLDWA